MFFTEPPKPCILAFVEDQFARYVSVPWLFLRIHTAYAVYYGCFVEQKRFETARPSLYLRQLDSNRSAFNLGLCRQRWHDNRGLVRKPFGYEYFARYLFNMYRILIGKEKENGNER